MALILVALILFAIGNTVWLGGAAVWYLVQSEPEKAKPYWAAFVQRVVVVLLWAGGYIVVATAVEAMK